MAKQPAIRLRDIQLIGKENIPADRGFLIVPNRLGSLDLLRLEAVLAGRKIAYLVEDGAALQPEARAHLERPDVTALSFAPHEIDPAACRKAVQEAAGGGAAVVYLPADAATLRAPATTVPGVKLEFLLRTETPVLPLHIHHPLETATSIETGIAESESILAFGPLLDGEDLTLANYQQSLFALAEECFSRNPLLGESLAWALLQGFKKHGTQNHLIDGKDGRKHGFDRLFAAALALSRVVKAETKKERVGIILPPGAAAFIANMAVMFAGKIPVNLNFTAGRSAIESSIRRAEIDKFLTADLFVRKMQTFPWPPLKQLILLERLLPSLKPKIALWLVLSKALPASLLASLLGISKKGGRKEAVLLFTSGSSGEPKGVVLSSRNLLANVAQFDTRLNLGPSDSILGCLPLFHSFGCTVTLWYPVIAGINLVTYPTPLEVKKLAELIEAHSVSVLLATPTFLRGYLRGINREQLATLKLIVTGAEKLPATMAEAFEARFGKRALEGYGLTETSPVSNVNLPDPEPLGDDAEGFCWLPSYRLGSVGQLLPGLAIRITHPETGEPLPLHQSGMIWFKGANIFEGYFKDPKRTAEVLTEDGWFRTGDVGRVDLDGFLYIEGRLSRFSKIGGEMVPHETVEEALVKTMGLEGESGRRIAVVGIPDPDKGEALVLLTSMPGGPEHQEILDLRYRLLDRGVPALWIPKKMIRVSEIPVLASGKLDVQGCEKIARGG